MHLHKLPFHWLMLSLICYVSVVSPRRSSNRRDVFKKASGLQDDSGHYASSPFSQQRTPFSSSRSEKRFNYWRENGRRGKFRRPLPAHKERKPNIILIMTDDQDIELGSLNFMPKTLKYLRDGGADFRSAYVTTPMCCPSRSSMLTGMYVHNHGVYTNNDNCSSPHWQATHETRTFATYLSNAGYRTGFFGKYLNKYNGSYIPPGWREWAGLIMNSRFYNYTINHNDQKKKHGFEYHKDYYPDLIANDSVAFLRQSKQHYTKKPVLLVMSFPAPHGPEDSAPQYSQLFFNVTTHHTPAYDFAPNPDKQWILQMTHRMEPIHKKFTDILMTKRLQTLQSVDDAVEKIYHELKNLGELDNTYIFYTSDHGYHLGQYGLVKGKSFPFEFDVRVPFLVRGPGITPGSLIEEIIINLDLAPTFLDIAGLDPAPQMDGKSFLKLLHKKRPGRQLNEKEEKFKWRDTFLIERGKVTPRQARHFNQVMYGTSEGSGELETDGMLLSVVESKSQRLAVECEKPQYKSPCQLYQKWECIYDGKSWRMQKCRLDGHLFPKKRRNCACINRPGGSFQKLDPGERKMQRAFLKDHVTKDIRHYKPKFLKTVRMKRSTLNTNVSDDAIEDVEFIMEDIAKELEGLEELRNATATMEPNPTLGGNIPKISHGCKFYNSNHINCTYEVYSDPEKWKSSKEYIDDQIRRFRLQLEELKDIRKHLKKKRPGIIPDQDEGAFYDYDDDYDYEYDDSEEEDKEFNVDDDDYIEKERLKKGQGRVEVSFMLPASYSSPPVPVTESSVPTLEENMGMETESTNVQPNQRKNRIKNKERNRNRNRGLGRQNFDRNKADVFNSFGTKWESTKETGNDWTLEQEEKPEEEHSLKNGSVETTEPSLVQPKRNSFSVQTEIKNKSREDDSMQTISGLGTSVQTQGGVLEWDNEQVTESTRDKSQERNPEWATGEIPNHRVPEFPGPAEGNILEQTRGRGRKQSTAFDFYSGKNYRGNKNNRPFRHGTSSDWKTDRNSFHNNRWIGGGGKKYDNWWKYPNGGGGRIDVTVYKPEDGAMLHNKRFPSYTDRGQVEERCICDERFAKKLAQTEMHEAMREARREARRKLKEERLKKKERKRKRKSRIETCNMEKMNCFVHDNDHWRTPPLWTGGPFCFCLNANNNTYWCLRTINTTHNFLYCEFITGHITYYDLRIDPYQLINIYHTLSDEELNFLHDQLMEMKICKGTKKCTIRNESSRKNEEKQRKRYKEVKSAPASFTLGPTEYTEDIAAAVEKNNQKKWKKRRHKRRQQGR